MRNDHYSQPATEERRLYGALIVSWYIYDVWYSQPASEAHTITPNRPLRNACIWQHFGAGKTQYTLKIILGGLDV